MSESRPATPSGPRARPRVLSGIRPTGSGFHLGNYLGAVRHWAAMQDEAECFFFLADLHAITVYNDPRELAANIRAMAAALIASGVDPNRSTLFAQSRAPAHAELAWLLNGTARMGWLNRMTQFKEKGGKDREGASVGLFAYPVLQAADVPGLPRTNNALEQLFGSQRYHERRATVIISRPSALTQTDGSGDRLTAARMPAAGLVQTKGLARRLCSAM